MISEFKGENPPPFLSKSPPVAPKVGVDLHINDLRKCQKTIYGLNH
ncbi:hypothetical protein [Peribacillus sp. NPDC097295]